MVSEVIQLYLWGVDMIEWKELNGNSGDELPKLGQVCLIAINCTPNIERGVYQGDGVWLSNWFSKRGNGECYTVIGWTPFADPEL